LADRLTVGSTLVVSSIPDYIIVLMAWIVLSLKLEIFPNTGYYPITDDPLETISYMMLPWLVLGMTALIDYARFTRGCDRPGGHDLRPRPRPAARRHDLRRADLLHQRHRLLGTGRTQESRGHQRHAGHRAGRLRPHRGRQPGRRPVLRSPGSPRHGRLGRA
jgi:hypothetical protein